MSEKTSPQHVELNAVVYARVSTSKQVKSLDTQVNICLDWCRRNNVNVLAIFKDVCSGDVPFKYRNKGKKLIDFIEKNGNKIHFVVVWTLDRIGRTSDVINDFLNLLAKHGIYIVETFSNNIISPVSLPSKFEIGLCKECKIKLLKYVLGS